MGCGPDIRTDSSARCARVGVLCMRSCCAVRAEHMLCCAAAEAAAEGEHGADSWRGMQACHRAQERAWYPAVARAVRVLVAYMRFFVECHPHLRDLLPRVVCVRCALQASSSPTNTPCPPCHASSSACSWYYVKSYAEGSGIVRLPAGIV